MKIGIITFHRAINYGAFLQAYALCSKLNLEEGIDAEIIDYNMEKEKEFYSFKINKGIVKHPIISFMRQKNMNSQKKKFSIDRRKMKLSSVHIISDSVEEFNKFVNSQKYDVIICGSDEVWKTDGFRGFPNAYWLIGSLNARKFSYAASSRSVFSKLKEDKRTQLINALDDFEFVGVRDTLTSREVLNYISDKTKVNLCCDPTFLYEFNPNLERGKVILRKITGARSNRKVIGVMIEDNFIAQRLYERLSDEYDMVCLYLWHPHYKNGCALSPFEWIDVMASCNCIVSSFFHAVCFALKHHTPILAIGTGAKNSKLSELERDIDKVSFRIYSPEIVNAENLTDVVNNIQIEMKRDNYVSNKLFDGYKKMLLQLKSK